MEVLTGKDLYVAFDEAMDEHNEPVGAVLVGHLESTDRPYPIYAVSYTHLTLPTIYSV